MEKQLTGFAFWDKLKPVLLDKLKHVLLDKLKHVLPGPDRGRYGLFTGAFPIQSTRLIFPFALPHENRFSPVPLFSHRIIGAASPVSTQLAGHASGPGPAKQTVPLKHDFRAMPVNHSL